MKQYPSISSDVIYGAYVYVFDKLDGSQIRAEWSPKKGFHKFGSRRILIDKNSKLLQSSVEMINDQYGAHLGKIFNTYQYKWVACFFEFYGKNSFAGQHIKDEEHEVILFDIAPYMQGILPPDEFLKLCGQVRIPKLLYQGPLDQDLIDKVKESKLDGMTFEGVVCKTRKNKKTERFKIKSNAWLTRLKEFCKGNDELYSSLK